MVFDSLCTCTQQGHDVMERGHVCMYVYIYIYVCVRFVCGLRRANVNSESLQSRQQEPHKMLLLREAYRY